MTAAGETPRGCGEEEEHWRRDGNKDWGEARADQEREQGEKNEKELSISCFMILKSAEVPPNFWSPYDLSVCKLLIKDGYTKNGSITPNKRHLLLTCQSATLNPFKVQIQPLIKNLKISLKFLKESLHSLQRLGHTIILVSSLSWCL